MSKSRQLNIIVEAAKKTKTETVMGKLANDNDPMEPWSKKHAPLEEEQLDEAGTLAKYIKSLGYDPKIMDFATRAKYARSNAFKKYKMQHYDDRDPKSATDIKLGEDAEHIEEISSTTAKDYMKKALHDTITGKKDRNTGMKRAMIRLAGLSKPLMTDEEVKGVAESYKQSPEEVERIRQAWAKKHPDIDNDVAKAEKEFQRHSNYQYASGAAYADGKAAHEKLHYLKSIRDTINRRKSTNEEVDCIHEDDYCPECMENPCVCGGNHLQEAGTGLLMSYIKSKGLDPTLMDGNKKAAYSKSSEFRMFKHKRLKEISGMGERGDDMSEDIVMEESDKKDIVSMDIPLLIRVLEYAREDAKTDMDLHKVVENLINMRTEGTLSMEHYDSITNIKEDSDPCWTGYQMVGTKKKNGKKVPNCVPMKELKEGIYGLEDSPLSATNSVKAMESNKKNYSKSARIIKGIYKKKGVKKETTYDWEKDDKGGTVEPTAKKILSGGKTMTGKDRDQVEIEPILKTRPNQRM